MLIQGCIHPHHALSAEEGEGSLAAARVAYKAAVSLRAQGVDPIARRAEEDARRRAKADAEARATQEAQLNNFSSVAEQFIALHVRPKLKPKPASYAERMVRNEMVKAWGKRPISGIGSREVVDLVQGIAARAPIQANRVMQTARKLFGWAQKRGVVESNPVEGLDKPGKEQSRDRVLSDAELAAVWAAAGGLGYPYGTLVQMLVLTGQRLGEVARMRWTDIDGEGHWLIPATKNDQPHGVTLPPLAREVLAPVRRFSGPYIFTSTGGETPLNGFSKSKARLDKLVAQTTPADTFAERWVLHDLRRTAASGMARLGVAPHVVEALLNHKSGQIRGVARVYNRFNYAPEVAHALTVWASHVEALVSGTPVERNVVPLRAAQSG